MERAGGVTAICSIYHSKRKNTREQDDKEELAQAKAGERNGIGRMGGARSAVQRV